jgi:hypothetical protein
MSGKEGESKGEKNLDEHFLGTYWLHVVNLVPPRNLLRSLKTCHVQAMEESFRGQGYIRAFVSLFLSYSLKAIARYSVANAHWWVGG